MGREICPRTPSPHNSSASINSFPGPEGERTTGVIWWTPQRRGLCTEWRKLRRPIDSFVYEPVIVGSLEDAFCATILNPDLAAIVINEGFALRSRHDAPMLRTLMASMGPQAESDLSAIRLAHILKRVRPELDLYLMSNRNVEEMAGNQEANVVRRIFYSIEELLELHLCILEGVQDRYD